MSEASATYFYRQFINLQYFVSGMQDQGLMADVVDFQTAFSLTVQVLNTVTVPQGDQYGTDTGSVEGSKADHSMFGLVRDHKDLALYW